LPSEQTVAPPATDQPSPPATETPTPAAEIEHTVAAGDSLSKLASKYKVSTADIREWNNLTNDNLFVGQKLIIKTAAPAQPAADQAPSAPAPTPAPQEQAPAPAPDQSTATAPADAAAADANAIEPPSEEPSVKPPANSKPVEYVVKGGDFLASIATKYKVKFQDIMTWNHLNNTSLSTGQKLTIYVPADFVVPEESAPAPADAPKPESPKSDAPADAPKPDAAPANADAPVAADTEVSYTVVKGDNLANIASRYGVTADDIRGWNGIEGNRIDVGQQLKIRPKKMPAE
jgi:peptidoglycan endopeptidase LytE